MTHPPFLARHIDRILAALAPYVEREPGASPAADGTLDRLDRLIDALLYLVSAFLMLAIAAVISWCIFARYALNHPPLWSEDVPMVLFVWMTFIALAVATRRGENIRVTFFIEKWSPRPRLALELLMHALVIAMMAVVLRFSFDIIRLQLRGTMLSTGWSNAVLWFPLPLGMALMMLFQIKLVRRSLQACRQALATAAIARRGDPGP